MERSVRGGVSQLSWTRVPDGSGFAHSAMLAAVAGGPGFVAVGSAGSPGSQAAVWTSPDGSSWTRAADSPELTGAEMNAIVRLDSGFVAVGWGSAGAAAWTSADGATWKRAPNATSLGGSEMTSLVRGAKLLVAVGPPTPNGDAGAIWTSPSGK